MELPSHDGKQRNRQACRWVHKAKVAPEAVAGPHDDLARRCVGNDERQPGVGGEQAVADFGPIVVVDGGEHDVGQPREPGRRPGRQERHDDGIRGVGHDSASPSVSRGRGTGSTRR